MATEFRGAKVQRQIENNTHTFNSIPQQNKPKVVSLKHSLSVGSQVLQAPCSAIAFLSDILNTIPMPWEIQMLPFSSSRKIISLPFLFPWPVKAYKLILTALMMINSMRLNNWIKHVSSHIHAPKVLWKKHVLFYYFSSLRGNISSPRGCGFSGVCQADWVSHSSAGQGWTPGELSPRHWRQSPGWVIDWLTPPLTVTDSPGPGSRSQLYVCFEKSQVRETPAGVSRKKKKKDWLGHLLLIYDSWTSCVQPWIMKM